MTRSYLGLSNPYLIAGALLFFVGLAAIAGSSFFFTDRELQAAALNIGALSLLSGIVVYVIGRVVQVKRSKEQA